MISHHERTHELYPNGAEQTEVDTTLLSISERSKSLPKELLSLEIGDLQEDYEIVWDYFEQSETADSVVHSQVDDLEKIEHIGLTFKELVSDSLSGKRLRKEERDLLEEIVKIDPNLENDLLKGATSPVTIERVLNVISQYYQGSNIETGVEICDEARERLISFLQDDSSASLIPDPSIRSRMVETILATPIVATDPLSTATAMKTSKFEYGGFFTSSGDRKAFVTFDPNSDLNDPLVRAQKAEIAYHELLHACFARNYRVINHEADKYEDAHTEIRQKRLFPSFVEEAVVEKIAFYLITEDLAAAGLLDGVAEKREGEFNRRSDMRARVGKYAARPGYESIGLPQLPSVLLDSEDLPKQEKARRLVYNSYPEFRVVLDYIFASADWKAAGLERSDAEGLLANAVFEVPAETDNKTKKWPHRKLFFSKLKGAKSAGVLNRFNSALGNFGVKEVTEWFDESPRDYIPGVEYNVDITDPNILPDSTAYKRFKEMEERLANNKEQLDRLVSMGAPSIVIGPIREMVSEIRKELKEQEKKALPAIGFKAHIDTDRKNYLRRRDRKSLSAIERRGLAEYRKKRENARNAGYRKI